MVKSNVINNGQKPSLPQGWGHKRKKLVLEANRNWSYRRGSPDGVCGIGRERSHWPPVAQQASASVTNTDLPLPPYPEPCQRLPWPDTPGRRSQEAYWTTSTVSILLEHKAKWESVGIESGETNAVILLSWPASNIQSTSGIVEYMSTAISL